MFNHISISVFSDCIISWFVADVVTTVYKHTVAMFIIDTAVSITTFDMHPRGYLYTPRRIICNINGSTDIEHVILQKI